jgi:polar amino acid transport system permease protein
MTPGPLLAFSGSDFTELLGGLGTSAQISALGFLFGWPLGLLTALCISTRNLALKAIGLAIVEFGRGMPVLVILYLVYFGLPSIGLTLTATTAAVVALAWGTCAYTSEGFRAGLDAVPHGQREAIAATGMTPLSGFVFIVLPQTLRVAIPAVASASIGMFQASALAYAISVPELMNRAYSIAAGNFQYVQTLVIAAAMYAAITIPASQGVSWLERRLARHL